MSFSLKKYSAYCAIILFWTIFFIVFLFWPLLWHESSENTLYVFSWPGILDPAYIKKFEQQHGIKVKISYYETNQELLVKLKATGGSGYDLIIPSDYTINILRKENLLQKIDKTQLGFLDRINPSLLSHYYDPTNDYSIPFDWGIYGIGIDTTAHKNSLPDASWKTIFEPTIGSGKIAMLNDPYESFALAKLYLFPDSTTLNSAQIEAITKLLQKQRDSIAVYTDARADYLLATHNCPLAVSSSTYMWRGMKEYSYLSFMIPREGTIMTVEGFAIPKKSAKASLAYAFLNFIYSPESLKHHFNYSAFLPATQDALDWDFLPADKKKLLVPSAQEFKKFHFLEPLMDEQKLYELWVKIKA